ncbi:imm11 family protein [Myxococcus hansupus]|uniref:imm11 family protein n=1 Tax=Pseudomyxococcus hansupus TaxID=1297742 RepID=UPI001D040C7F|nr:DUF1629 domain-containing protein [Myxococcus hansupus]
MKTYLLLEPTTDETAAHFWHMRNYDDQFELSEGIPLSGTFPSDAAYRMSDEAPDKTALYEVLYNLDGQFVVHEKVRTFLEKENVQHVEYLPVKVLNHKDREVKERYFVVNMLPLVDCVDLDQTKFKRNRLNPDQLMDISNLSVHEEKIPPDFQLLRLKAVSGAMLIHRDLAAKLKAAGFRGFATPEVSEYSGN